MNRAERRERSERKWISRLKRVFNSGYRDFVLKIKTSDWNYSKAKTFDELKKDKYGVMLKNTGTICSDKRLDIQEEHKRNVANRTLSKEDKEDLDNYVNDMNNPFAFEKYCGACDYFNTDECQFNAFVCDNTDWKKLGCNNFMD